MPDLFERILLLKGSTIFSRVETEDLMVVAQVLTEEYYGIGECVFAKGERGDHMYVVASGEVGISLDPEGCETRYVARLGAGECFGEMNLLDDQDRSATAKVLKEATLLALEKGRLHGLMRRYPELGIGMLKGLSLRLRETNQREQEN